MGRVVGDSAAEANAIPESPESPPTGVDFLLKGYAARITAGYPSGAPLLKQAVQRVLNEELGATDGLRWRGLVSLAAYDLFDDHAIYTLATRWVRLAREHAALTIRPMPLAYLGGPELTAPRLQQCEA